MSTRVEPRGKARGAPLPTTGFAPTTMGSSDAEAKFHRLRKEREARRTQLINQGSMQDPGQARSLGVAQNLVGTCQDMCPAFELVERDMQRELDPLEQGGQPAVKIYRRPAAGREVPLPEDVRPPPILLRTLDYLFHDLLPDDPFDARFSQIQAFVWNRTRAIRQDFVVQNVHGTEAIAAHERIARYHILILRFRGGSVQADGQALEPGTNADGTRAENTWSQQQELEQLRKTLRSLVEYYDDARLDRGPDQSHDAPVSPHEGEFRAYQLLLGAYDAEALREVELLPQPVLGHPTLQTALKIRALIQGCNPAALRRSDAVSLPSHGLASFARFFSLIQRDETDYLLGCVAEKLFGDVRRAGMRALSRAIRRGDAPPVKWLVRALGFDDESQVLDLASQLDVRPTVNDTTGIQSLELSHVPIAAGKPIKTPFCRALEVKRAGRTCQQIIDQPGVPTLGTTKSLPTIPAAPSFSQPKLSTQLPQQPLASSANGSAVPPTAGSAKLNPFANQFVPRAPAAPPTAAQPPAPTLAPPATQSAFSVGASAVPTANGSTGFSTNPFGTKPAASGRLAAPISAFASSFPAPTASAAPAAPSPALQPAQPAQPTTNVFNQSSSAKIFGPKPEPAPGAASKSSTLAPGEQCVPPKPSFALPSKPAAPTAPTAQEQPKPPPSLSFQPPSTSPSKSLFEPEPLSAVPEETKSQASSAFAPAPPAPAVTEPKPPPPTQLSWAPPAGNFSLPARRPATQIPQRPSFAPPPVPASVGPGLNPAPSASAIRRLTEAQESRMRSRLCDRIYRRLAETVIRVPLEQASQVALKRVRQHRRYASLASSLYDRLASEAIQQPAQRACSVAGANTYRDVQLLSRTFSKWRTQLQEYRWEAMMDRAQSVIQRAMVPHALSTDDEQGLGVDDLQGFMAFIVRRKLRDALWAQGQFTLLLFERVEDTATLYSDLWPNITYVLCSFSHATQGPDAALSAYLRNALSEDELQIINKNHQLRIRSFPPSDSPDSGSILLSIVECSPTSSDALNDARSRIAELTSYVKSQSATKWIPQLLVLAWPGPDQRRTTLGQLLPEVELWPGGLDSVHIVQLSPGAQPAYRLQSGPDPEVLASMFDSGVTHLLRRVQLAPRHTPGATVRTVHGYASPLLAAWRTALDSASEALQEITIHTTDLATHHTQKIWYEALQLANLLLVLVCKHSETLVEEEQVSLPIVPSPSAPQDPHTLLWTLALNEVDQCVQTRPFAGLDLVAAQVHSAHAVRSAYPALRTVDELLSAALGYLDEHWLRPDSSTWDTTQEQFQRICTVWTQSVRDALQEVRLSLPPEFTPAPAPVPAPVPAPTLSKRKHSSVHGTTQPEDEQRKRTKSDDVPLALARLRAAMSRSKRYLS